MGILETVFLAALACAYATRVLVLEKKVSHEGPFILKETYVLFQDNNHIQNFGLFDIIRLIFGAYERVKDMPQRVYTPRLEHWTGQLWTCHVCLSWWVALPFSVFILLQYQLPLAHIGIIHFAIASFSAFVNDIGK